tara:strand:+ start:6962 stop:7678 length:717 start_codon:yes stop_codon:yes gene_type:complete
MKKDIVFIPNTFLTSTSQYSIKSWKEWSHNNNCEVLILENDIYEDSSFNKFLIFDLLESSNIEYNQILIATPDSIIHPQSPNIFKLTDNKLCGAFYDSNYDFLLRNIENYSKHLFNNFTFPYWEYLDTGLLIINNNHKEFINKIKDFYLENSTNIDTLKKTYNLSSDQPVFNFLMHQEKIDFKVLPYEWNMQDLLRKEAITNTDHTLFTNIGWIYQFNQIFDSNKEYLMSNTYKNLYQ